MTGHPSTFALDAHAHGLAADPAVASHVESCERCRVLVDNAREDAARFSRSVLPRTIDAVAMRRPRISWMWALAPALAVIPVLLWMRIPRPLDPAMMPRVEQATPMERDAPATAKLVVYDRPVGTDMAGELTEGSAIAPGELLRFMVEQHGLPYVVVCSVDARGAVTVRAPIDGGLALDVSGGKGILPGSWLVERDTAPVDVVALFSIQALDSEALRGALERGALPADVVERRLHLSRAP